MFKIWLSLVSLRKLVLFYTDVGRSAIKFQLHFKKLPSMNLLRVYIFSRSIFSEAKLHFRSSGGSRKELEGTIASNWKVTATFSEIIPIVVPFLVLAHCRKIPSSTYV